MNVEDVKKLTVLQRFLYWIRERRQILRKKRAGKPKPWTDDRVLQTCYFCNVEREDDKVTTWFRENIRNPLKDKPEVVFATIAFRWFNHIPTGEVLRGGDLSADYRCNNLLIFWDLQDTLDRLSEVKDQVFTGAFNISNSGSTKPKINRVCEDYIQPVWERKEQLLECLRTHNTMASAFEYLQMLPGLGGSGFMAAQVICDLAYTHVLKDAKDWWTWCSWGPGSKRGMNRVFGHPIEHTMSKADWLVRLEDLRIEIEYRLRLNLHARDVQNCLCEFDKYERVLWGEGQSKRRYPGNA